MKAPGFVPIFFVLICGIFAAAANAKPVVLKEAAELGNVALDGADAPGGAIDGASLPKGEREIDGVPFVFSEKARAIDAAPSMSGVAEPFRNGYFNYPTLQARRAAGRAVLTAPGDQYSAIDLIAFSAGRPDHVPRVTVRISTGGALNNIRAAINESAVVQVPLLTAAGVSADAGVVSRLAVKLADGRKGNLYHLRVVIPQTANLAEFASLEVEFTRDLAIHVVPPDPNEFGRIPAGPPSDVVVLAATLEPSPVKMTYESDEPGNVFADGEKVRFHMKLLNRSDAATKAVASLHGEGPGTKEELISGFQDWETAAAVDLAPNEEKTVELEAPALKRGWYDCTVGASVKGEMVQQRHSSLAVLAPDTRKAGFESPFGVWEFWYSHSIARDANHVSKLVSLIHKGGWRHTYGGAPVLPKTDPDPIYTDLRDNHQIQFGLRSLPQSYESGEGWFDQAEFDHSIAPVLKHWLDLFDPHMKVMHESRSSTDLLRRYSEFLGGTPYAMPEAETQKVEKQFAHVAAYCRAVKSTDPRAKVVLFNDYPSVVEQFLRRKFPSDAFDTIGLEGAMFMREPERQPDWMCLLGNMQQVHRIMKKYGYDKPVWTTEALYHPTAEGSLSLHRQGVIAVREAMLGLQLGIERFAAAGIIKDPSDDYHWSNWGSAGYCFREPEINPKPSYAMYAWLTQVLDQAKPVGALATPNHSLQLLDFRKSDGSHVYAIWVVRGLQKVTLKTTGKPELDDVYGNPLQGGGGGSLIVTASQTPLYITGGTIDSVVGVEPLEVATDGGQTVLDLARPDMVDAVPERNPVLESNWDTPRLRGSFETTTIKEGADHGLYVTMQPDDDARKLLPRYVEYRLRQSIKLPGRPFRLTARVKGNAEWGQIIFEVVDAKGRVWTSCGNQYAGSSNSSDCEGDSYVSFTGWQTMTVPVMGQYAGHDQTLSWPRNYNWWPTHTPEELELPAKVEQTKHDYDTAMVAYKDAVTKHEAAMVKYAVAAEAARQAHKAVPAPPKAPVEPRLNLPKNMGICAVDYPLTLTKIIVTMRPHILYVDQEVPVNNATIVIEKIGVVDAPAGY